MTATMDYTTKTIEKGWRLEVQLDNDPVNPLADVDDVIFHMAHARYNLYNTYPSGDGWHTVDRTQVGVLLPLYMYDHGLIALDTTPFSTAYDSGLIGYAIITKASLKEHFTDLEEAEQYIRGLLDQYVQYLNGNVYRYELYYNGDLRSSCGGFYGTDFMDNGMGYYLEAYLSKDDVFTMIQALGGDVA